MCVFFNAYFISTPGKASLQAYFQTLKTRFLVIPKVTFEQNGFWQTSRTTCIPKHCTVSFERASVIDVVSKLLWYGVQFSAHPLSEYANSNCGDNVPVISFSGLDKSPLLAPDPFVLHHYRRRYFNKQAVIEQRRMADINIRRFTYAIFSARPGGPFFFENDSLL